MKIKIYILLVITFVSLFIWFSYEDEKHSESSHTNVEHNKLKGENHQENMNYKESDITSPNPKLTLSGNKQKDSSIHAKNGSAEVITKELYIAVDDLIDKQGGLHLDKIEIVLSADNFGSVLSHLSLSSTQSDIERELEIKDFLTTFELMNNYPYDISCGKGLCALNILDIPNNEKETLQNEVLSNLDFGSNFRADKAINNSTSGIRVIYNSTKSETTSVISSRPVF